MRVSFTGTRIGCSNFQLERLEEWLEEHKSQMTLASHGCCIGADIQFHKLVRRICGNSVYVAVYPSTAKTRAPIPEDANFVAERRPPLDRNKTIVDVGHDLLLACPSSNERIVRSGTWHAVRYAEKRKVPVETFWRSQRV